MRRAAESVGFLTLALGLHVAVLALAGDRESGMEAAGAEGAAQISLQAADAQLVAMVERLERPPEEATAAAMPAMTAPETIQSPEIPAPAMHAPAAPEGLAMPAIPEMPERAPPLDREVTRSPPPPEDVAEAGPTQTSARPQLRPKSLAPPPKRRVEPKRAPKKVRTPSPAQRASGAGAGAHTGRTQDQEAATLSTGERQSLTARWGAQIRNSVERRKRYPAAARGVSGTVTVRLTISGSGGLQDVRLTQSSGNDALDQAALRAVHAARFPAAPTGLTQSSYSFTLPMKFSS
ncbi:TonB family protein [Sulfitobacter aestuarii]|uniref:TonB family protein n=1 Tax=Sulfitobacter aestuarii TaxID=2161676 RepID=A0ABW5U558_9RHOB